MLTNKEKIKKDASALKTAIVGLTMGSMGSDIAVEAADIALR